MFDKKNAAKVKPIVDYALSAEGQKNCFRSWLHSIELIKVNFLEFGEKVASLGQPFFY
jgi:hypothetical protein